MRLRSYFLAAAGTVVVVLGIYLWLDVRGTSADGPSPEALAAAQARHAQEAAPAAGRAARPDVTGDVRRRAGFPRPRADLTALGSGAGEPPPLTDRLRASGPKQPAIDPDEPELASAMTEANKMYDRGDYEGARSMALKLLGREPTNVRMLRVVVSSSCILGDADVATQHWNKLPAPDQQTMAIRCARYQVTFPGAGTVPLEK